MKEYEVAVREINSAGLPVVVESQLILGTRAPLIRCEFVWDGKRARTEEYIFSDVDDGTGVASFVIGAITRHCV